MSSDTESRFAHLLQPIRALADNWNIDIARELEDYLGELEKISFSFDGESNSLNFAEAALVIQGSAVVYSKKVEYLYALLYQTLDYLVEKKQQRKAQQEATGDDNEGGEAEPDFLSLDDALEEGKGIDLVEGDNVPVRQPRISSHINLVPIQPDIEPFNSNNENPKNGGRRSDYSMNTFVVDSNGALVQPHDISKHSDFSSTPFATPRPSMSSAGMETDFTPYSNTSVLGPNSSVLSSIAPNTSVLSSNMPSSLNTTHDVSTAPGGGGLDLPGGGAQSDEEDNEAEDDDEERPSIFGQQSFANSNANATNTTNAADGEKAGYNLRERRKKVVAEKRPKTRMVDMWAMLDPHEEVGVVKNFKKGKPYRIRQNTKPEEPEADAVVPILSIAETPLTFRGVRGPAFQEFAYLYSAELKRRKESKKRANLEFSFEETVYAAAAEEEEESHEVPEFSHSTHFNGATADVNEEESAGGVDLGGVDDDDDDVDDAGDAGMLFSQEESVDTQSYEDFYAARVEQFISETAQYAQETNLTKRVNDWKTKLAPVLEEQESHKNFDILEYGETLIHTLRTEYEGKPGVSISEEGEVDAEDGLIVPFSKLTVGVERYEVARRFAAILQLVNNQNVSVVTNHEVDSLSFHLLSVKPKYDIENYRAPSLNPSSASSTPSSTPLPSSSQNKTKAKKDDKTTTKAKRGRTKATEEEKEEEEEGPSKKGKKAAGKGKKGQNEAGNDKENVPANRETRGKRKERINTRNYEEEEEEEVLRGPRTKMFTEVKV